MPTALRIRCSTVAHMETKHGAVAGMEELKPSGPFVHPSSRLGSRGVTAEIGQRLIVHPLIKSLEEAAMPIAVPI